MTSKRRALMMAQGGAEPTFYVNGYVGNGLLHYWDGIDNRGIGEAHASSGFPWKDLAGTRDIVLADRVEQSIRCTTDFSANALYINTQRNYRQCFKLGDTLDLSNREITVEVRFMAGYSGEASPLSCSYAATQPTFAFFQNKNAGTVGIIGNADVAYKQYAYIATEEEQTDYHTLAMTYKLNASKLDFYVNGLLAGNYTPIPSAEVFTNRLLIRPKNIAIGSSCYQVVNGSYLNPGYISRICIYNKALTSVEIASNYQNDLTRFTS